MLNVLCYYVSSDKLPLIVLQVAWRKLGDQSDGENVPSQPTVGPAQNLPARSAAPPDSLLSSVSYRPPLTSDAQYNRPVERPRPTRPSAPFQAPVVSLGSTLPASGPRPSHPAVTGTTGTNHVGNVRQSRVQNSSPVRHRLDTQF